MEQRMTAYDWAIWSPITLKICEKSSKTEHEYLHQRVTIHPISAKTFVGEKQTNEVIVIYCLSLCEQIYTTQFQWLIKLSLHREEINLS